MVILQWRDNLVLTRLLGKLLGIPVVRNGNFREGVIATKDYEFLRNNNLKQFNFVISEPVLDSNSEFIKMHGSRVLGALVIQISFGRSNDYPRNTEKEKTSGAKKRASLQLA